MSNPRSQVIDFGDFLFNRHSRWSADREPNGFFVRRNVIYLLFKQNSYTLVNTTPVNQRNMNVIIRKK